MHVTNYKYEAFIIHQCMIVYLVGVKHAQVYSLIGFEGR